MLKGLLKFLAVAVICVVLLAAGAYVWASVTSSRLLARTFEVHSVDFPVPQPLPDAEVDSLGLSPEEADALAFERARERGRHLLEARYPCAECHGSDFSGGVMVDAFPIGRLLGPNITAGQGSKTLRYTPADWDRIVRHGILPDGSPATMPSEDFQRMSDQELSDIIAYLSEVPAVDNEVPPIELGPLGKILVATGEIHLSADVIGDHMSPHSEFPPPAEVTLDFGGHLAATCTGCHGSDFAGGPIPGGDPSWPTAANLTPHPDGLGSWSYEAFATAMRSGRRADGTMLALPMSTVVPFGEQMTETVMAALWMYLESLPPVPTVQ